MQYIFNFAVTNFKSMAMDRILPGKIEQLAYRCRNIVIVSHANPDGDAAGSSTAFRNFLASKNIQSTIILPDRMPSFLDFLDTESSIVCFRDKEAEAAAIIGKADLIICLDFNKPSRIDGMEKFLIGSGACKILIDHHLEPDTSAFDIIVSDPGASSTCELLFKVLMAFPSVNGNPADIGKPALESLATGLITDTNNFNNSLTPDTFRMASVLLGEGVDFRGLNERIFKRYSESRMRMQGYLLKDVMKLNWSLGSAFMTITMEDKKKFCYSDGDSEGFVNLPLQIGNVKVSALFTETPDYIKVSLRSKGSFSVNRLARRFFNGGGHENAAGGRLYGITISEVGEYFEKSLEQFLQSGEVE